MDESGFLASAHRRVVDDFIQAVLDEWACDMGDVERNIVGVALRQEVETPACPGAAGVARPPTGGGRGDAGETSRVAGSRSESDGFGRGVSH